MKTRFILCKVFLLVINEIKFEVATKSSLELEEKQMECFCKVNEENIIQQMTMSPVIGLGLAFITFR